MTTLPKFTTLCGIGYNITVHEGMVIFEESHCMFGCHRRMSFHRVEEKDGSGMWHIETDSTWKSTPVSHIVAAYDMLKEVYGGSFECKQPL